MSRLSIGACCGWQGASPSSGCEKRSSNKPAMRSSSTGSPQPAALTRQSDGDEMHSRRNAGVPGLLRRDANAGGRGHGRPLRLPRRPWRRRGEESLLTPPVRFSPDFTPCYSARLRGIVNKYPTACITYKRHTQITSSQRQNQKTLKKKEVKLKNHNQIVKTTASQIAAKASPSARPTPPQSNSAAARASSAPSPRRCAAPSPPPPQSLPAARRWGGRGLDFA